MHAVWTSLCLAMLACCDTGFAQIPTTQPAPKSRDVQQPLPAAPTLPLHSDPESTTLFGTMLVNPVERTLDDISKKNGAVYCVGGIFWYPDQMKPSEREKYLAKSRKVRESRCIVTPMRDAKPSPGNRYWPVLPVDPFTWYFNPSTRVQRVASWAGSNNYGLDNPGEHDGRESRRTFLEFMVEFETFPGWIPAWLRGLKVCGWE